MSQENSNAAEEFVKKTAAQLQKSFRNTLIVAVIILVLESIYFTVLNNKIAEGLTAIPSLVDAYRDDFDKIKELAGKIPDKTEYADRMVEIEGYLDKINKEGGTEVVGMANLISQKIVAELDYQGHMVSSTATKYLKTNVDKAPDWVRKQIPEYGARMRHETKNWMNAYCAAASNELGKTFDTFLDDHADKIREFSERADDEATLDGLDEALTDELVYFMENTSIEKYGSLKMQSDKFLRRLEAANELLHPLATKKTEDLSNQQLRLRKALGLFMEKLNNPSGNN
jgi:hypothetical protein